MKCFDITPFVCDELGGCAVIVCEEFKVLMAFLSFFCYLAARYGEGALPLGSNTPACYLGSWRWVTLTVNAWSCFLLALAICLSSYALITT